MNRTSRLLAAIPALALAVACGNAPTDGRAGSIDVDGSSTVGPLTDAIAEEYAAVEPNVTVNLSISGTGGGFERFCGTGDIQITNASRPIKDEEADLCDENGIDFLEVRVGTDALTMVTHPATDYLDCLTTDEIRSFWREPGVSRWNEVRSSFPADEIKVFAPDVDSGTFDFFNETVLEPDAESIADYNASADDNIIAEGVIGTPGSWGYFGFAYLQENAERLKAIAYDAGEGCVEPSVAASQDGSYALTRPLYIYVATDALSQEHVADFVTFYLDTVEDVIEDVGYIAEAADDLQAAKDELAEAIANA